MNTGSFLQIKLKKKTKKENQNKKKEKHRKRKNIIRDIASENHRTSFQDERKLGLHTPSDNKNTEK